MARILFSPIQNHDNKEQARIYPPKLKDIVPGRQSGIIAGLNKCKILTGTNASNGSRTRGYIFPFCSPPLPGMYLCSLPYDHPGRLGGRRPLCLHRLMRLTEVDEEPYQYQMDSCAAFNAEHPKHRPVCVIWIRRGNITYI